MRRFIKLINFCVILMVCLILTSFLMVSCTKDRGDEVINKEMGEKMNPIIRFSFNEDSGCYTKESMGLLDEGFVNYVFNQAKYKKSEDPLWRKNGIKQGALLFDGYSTYIEYKNVDLALDGLSISVWVAPRAYEWGDKNQLSAIINQHNPQRREGFIFGLYRHGQFGIKVGTENGWYELMASDKDLLLDKYKWSNIGATYDSKTGELSLFKDGKKVVTKEFPPSPIKNSTKPLIIGKHNEATAISVFSANMFNGMMDELVLYNQAIDEKEMEQYYEEGINQETGKVTTIPWDSIKLDASILEDDPNRPLYHVGAPQHWMNEPHAPIYYNGYYHLFYQHNPFGPFWHQIHWGHWVSKDMIHWKNVDVALSPEYKSIAPDGIWSGSATYDSDGKPVLFFTAGNDSKKPNQAVAIATPEDSNDPYLEKWIMADKTLVEQEKGQGKFGEFRDPFVWYDKDVQRWYMLVASGLEGRGGTALAYVSEDMENWEYKGPFYISDYATYPFLGQHWELPVLLPVRNDNGLEKYIFLFSPHGDGADVEVYYFLGEFDKENVRFIPETKEPKLIDLGNGIFTGPSGFVDPITNRTILFTITQGNREPWDEYYAGWAHNAGMPMELFLNEKGELNIKPIEEVYSLRDELLIDMENVSIEEVNRELKLVKGELLNIEVGFRNKDSTEFGLHVRKTEDSIEQTSIYYDEEKQGLYVNRLKSSLDQPYKGTPGGNYKYNGDILNLEILMDRSIIEIYANEEKSLTTRVYPTLKDALGLECFSKDGDVTIEYIKVWSMKSADIR